MNILLYPNLDKKNALTCTQQTVEKLHEYGAVPMLEECYRETVGEGTCTYGRFADLIARCDVIMPIGGDGTIMRAARHAVVCARPIIAINVGRVGFLTQIEPNELENLQLLVERKYTIHKRMMIEAEIQLKDKRRRYSGLNDIVVSRGDLDRIAVIEVRQHGMLIASHRADGIIFSTPTGATAYSLAAGGPIVDPNMRLVIMTAICPHSTFSRSMILSTDFEYTIVDRSGNNPKGLTLAVDGRRVGKIEGDQKLVVRKSAAEVQMIDIGLRTFYQTVNEKLSWGNAT